MTMNEKTDARPIRVHAGLDVYDLPPDTPARVPGNVEQTTLDTLAGRPEAVVTICGRERLVHVENDGLAADRWWREAQSLRAAVRVEPFVLVPKPSGPAIQVREQTPSTPRERDPIVWAAAYAAEVHGQTRDIALALDGTPDDRVRRAAQAFDVERCKVVADAAVMALRVEAGR